MFKDNTSVKNVWLNLDCYHSSLVYLGNAVKCKDTDGLVQKWRNSIANALELRLSCTNPSLHADHDLTLWEIDSLKENIHRVV